MRVLLVSNMYTYPGNWDKLDELGRHVDLHVITPERWATRHELHPVTALRSDGSRGWVHHPLPTITQGNPFRYVFRPGPLLRVLRAVRPDVVHVEQEPESLALLQLSLLKLVFGYRVVFVAWENVNPLRLGWAFRKASFALADGAIFGNEAARERCLRLGYRGPYTMTPQYGFELAPDVAARPDGERLAGGRFALGYAGRLVPEKGIATLLSALDALPGVELVVAGDGPLHDEVLAHPRVRWLGNLDRDDLGRFWRSIDALAIPSLTTRKWAEQFGRVAVEAMAHGVPVIGSDSGAIPEVIGDAGLVVPEADGSALAGAVDRLRLDPGLRARLVAAGRDRVERVYHHDVVMPATAAFHRSVLDGGGGSPRPAIGRSRGGGR